MEGIHIVKLAFLHHWGSMRVVQNVAWHRQEGIVEVGNNN